MTKLAGPRIVVIQYAIVLAFSCFMAVPLTPAPAARTARGRTPPMPRATPTMNGTTAGAIEPPIAVMTVAPIMMITRPAAATGVSSA